MVPSLILPRYSEVVVKDEDIPDVEFESRPPIYAKVDVPCKYCVCTHTMEQLVKQMKQADSRTSDDLDEAKDAVASVPYISSVKAA